MDVLVWLYYKRQQNQDVITLSSTLLCNAPQRPEGWVAAAIEAEQGGNKQMVSLLLIKYINK